MKLLRRRAAFGFAVALFGLLTLAPTSLEAGSPATTLQFSRMPGRVVAGQPVSVTIGHARPGVLCTLGVSYAKDGNQPGLQPKAAIGGLVTWTWTVPNTIQANVARLSAHCAGTKKISAGMLVVGGLIPPRMTVEKDGFTPRVSTTGSTNVSYGIIVKNHSPNADALDVNVLINFVMADDHLIGSTSAKIPMIPAGTSYALGGSFGFPAAAPIARLEIVMQTGSTQRHVGHAPAVANVVIEPSLYDKGWVGDVAGEVINNDAHLMLQATQFSAVVLDGAGNVIGGGNGSTYGALPPGTRMVFKLTSGFSDIPVENAVSVVVSASPTWQQPAS